jgi:hypothetical protein
MPPAGPASDHEREQQPAEQAPAQPGPAAPGQAPGPLGADPDRLADDWDNLPAHPTARPVRQAAVARLQARHGNRHVQRRLRADQPLPVQRFWGLFKPTQPQVPQNWPDMTARVASLKNEEKVYLNLSTAYSNRGQEGMDGLIADIDQELTKYAPNDKAACLAVINGQRAKIIAHRDRFVPTFEASARDTVYTLLDTSRKGILDEMQRYGMHEDMETKAGETKPTGKMEVTPTADMDDLAKAAKHIAGEAEKLFNLGLKLKEKYGSQHKGGPMEEAANRAAVERDMLNDMTWVEANQKYELLYSDYMQKYPILAAIKNEPNAVAALRSGGKSEVGNAMLWEQLKKRLDNIAETRTNVAPGGSLNPLSLPNIVAGAKASSNTLPGSLENRFVDDATGKLKADKESRDKALAAIGVTLAIVAAVATAGGSLVVAAGTTGFGLGLSAGEIVNKLQLYQVESAAANTDLDKAKSISKNDPDLFWLAVDIALFVADLVQAGHLLRQAAGPVRKFASARVAAERAGGGKLTADEGERLAKMLTDEVDPALAGLPGEARQRVRGKLDPTQKMPSVVSAATRGARWSDATLQKALRGSAQGQEAWQKMLQHKTTLAVSPTDACSFDPTSNTVFIGRGLSPDDAAHAFVHEMTHADWLKAGKTVAAAEMKTISRFEYINRMCREEADAEVAAIKHKFQSQFKSGKPIQVTSPVEQVYSDAYAAEARHLRAATPNIDESVLQMRAEIVAQQAVYKAIIDGRVVNSITKESYVIYYGRAWDSVNMPLPRYKLPDEP